MTLSGELVMLTGVDGGLLTVCVASRWAAFTWLTCDTEPSGLELWSLDPGPSPSD